VLLALLAPAVARAALPAGLPDAFWRRDVSTAPVDAQSSEIIAWLAAQGGFGTGFPQIDFSMEVLEGSAATPRAAFVPTDDWWDPDCDTDPVPLPAGGDLEGEAGYACSGGGDCHLIVWLADTQRLFEMWRANFTQGQLYGGCLAIWQLDAHYGPSGRGRDCSSADAAGLPIAPLLFDADEVAAGAIDHAIRFILPNERIRHRSYVAPASHGTDQASGPDSAPPYGARLRLRADFLLESLPSEPARAIARALQRYGMILADGGSIALTARSDRFTAARWSDLLDSHALDAVAVTDFEMIEGGTRFSYTGDCVRVPEPGPGVAAASALAALVACRVRRRSERRA
jgi:hypothetical protein